MGAMRGRKLVPIVLLGAAASAHGAACPVTSTLSFSGAVGPCPDATSVCTTTCTTALAMPFIMTGQVAPTDAATIGSCISSYAGAIMTAGVPGSVLAALGSCPSSSASSPPPPALSLPPPAAPTCPISAALDFSGAAVPCGSLSLACSAGCSAALGTPIVIAGVSPSNLPVISACIAAHAGEVIAAGVPVAVLSALSTCGAAASPPQPPPPKATAPPPAATCPITAALDFSGAVGACGSVSAACTPACSAALGTPIVIAGVSPSNLPVIAACISAKAGEVIAAGVPVAVLSALGSCSAPAASSPPPPIASPPPVSCPVTAALDFRGAVSACGSVSAACTSACSTALGTPIVIAGVSPSNPAVIAACISAHAGEVIAAGIPVAVLSALGGCSSPAASPPPAAATPPATPRPSPPPPPPRMIRCPVSASMPLDFTPATTLCGSIAVACSSDCAGALSYPFVGNGVNSTDNATIAACVTSRYMDIVGAGVSASVLFARASCAGAAYPFPPPLASPPPLLSTAANGTGSVSAPPAPPPPQCPIKYALSFFGAPLACQNASTYCTDCANALSLPIALAGVAGNTALVASCIESHTLEVLAAGVNPAALQQTRACFSPWISPPPSPPPPPSKEPPGVSASFSSAAAPLPIAGTRTWCLAAAATAAVLFTGRALNDA